MGETGRRETVGKSIFKDLRISRFLLAAVEEMFRYNSAQNQKYIFFLLPVVLFISLDSFGDIRSNAVKKVVPVSKKVVPV